METRIEVAVNGETASAFIRALLFNLDQPDADRTLVWIRDTAGAFHTRIHYGQVPVVLTSAGRDRPLTFASLCIHAFTRPLEPENADLLTAHIIREQLDKEAAALTDRLVAKLAQVPAEHHDLTRMLDKFCSDNR